MEREITLREYGRVLWSGRWIIVACVVVAVLVGALLSLVSTTTYTATAQLSLGQATTVSGTPVQTSATNPATAPTVLLSDLLVVDVAGKLDMKPGEVRSAVDLSAPRTSGGAAGNQPTLISLTWTDSDRETALRGANTYAEHIREYMEKTNSGVIDTYRISVTRGRAAVTRLTTEIEGYRRQLANAQSSDQRIVLQSLLSAATSQLSSTQTQLADQQIALAKAEQLEQTRIISLAEDPTRSGGAAGLARSVVLAGFIGLILGIVITFIWRGSPAGRAGRQEPERPSE